METISNFNRQKNSSLSHSLPQIIYGLETKSVAWICNRQRFANGKWRCICSHLYTHHLCF